MHCFVSTGPECAMHKGACIILMCNMCVRSDRVCAVHKGACTVLMCNECVCSAHVCA